MLGANSYSMAQLVLNRNSHPTSIAPDSHLSERLDRYMVDN